MTLVSHSEFLERLRALVIQRAEDVNGPIALYAEREIRKDRGTPNRLFKEDRNRRAHGDGPEPVKPTKSYDPDVGSEGIIAWMITELCREQPTRFLNHPGPDRLRRKRARAFFLLTDFIGSGGRALAYLEAAWRVASVRSWWSLNIFGFHVVSYSGTAAGLALVAKHHSKPSIRYVIPCPTIDSEFDGHLQHRICDLCRRYDPVDHDPVEALGYKGGGALIAFAHSCPNNAPRILHKKDRRWRPLFPGRVTAMSRGFFGDRRDDASLLDRLMRLRERHLATGKWLPQTSREGRAMILLLAALRRGPRLDEALARKTGFTIPEVSALLDRALDWGWVAPNRRLTDAGLGQLIQARKLQHLSYTLPVEPDKPYYPGSLRAPGWLI
jgi:hypothetical protein